jgi:ribosomal protein S6--L-glutamate ligase
MAIIYGEISTRHQLLMERARDIFDSVLAAPVDGLKFVHGEDGTKLLYKDTDLTKFDAVYIRTGDKDQYYSEHLSEVLNESGVITQASNDTYAYESNKFYSMKVLADNGVNVPNSVYTLSPDTAIKAAEKLGYPVILKTARGAGGEGVMRVSSENELRPIMDAMKSFEQDIVLQEYIEHNGTDNRVVVIGDYITAYSRSSSGDEWRSNISGGGDRLKADLTDEMKKAALTAARATGFDMCGCDIIKHDDEVYILEVNGSYGISEEMNEIVGEDVMLRMVEWLHDRAMKKQVEDK